MKGKRYKVPFALCLSTSMLLLPVLIGDTLQVSSIIFLVFYFLVVYYLVELCKFPEFMVIDFQLCELCSCYFLLFEIKALNLYLYINASNLFDQVVLSEIITN
ncbi:hypothetical protein S245_060542 [Arachis hypogaea]